MDLLSLSLGLVGMMNPSYEAQPPVPPLPTSEVYFIGGGMEWFDEAKKRYLEKLLANRDDKDILELAMMFLRTRR